MNTQSNTLLLHSCCAPCTIMPFKLLAEQGWESVLFFYNPNIHPVEEYEKRLVTLRSYATLLGAPLIEAPYEVDAWEASVGKEGGPYPLIESASDYEEMKRLRQVRCRACYTLRFEALAQKAASLGLETISSTLSVSPYQFTRVIHDTLQSCAQNEGVNVLSSDWRPYYSEASTKARELALYRQNYCGCRFSKEEAQIEREARKQNRVKRVQ